MDETVEKQLDEFLAKYLPDIEEFAREARANMQKRLPGALELVYDNYNALVIGYGPTEKASDAILSIALYPKWVSLFFLQGAGLPDPMNLLKGSGSVAKHIVLASPGDLNKPAIKDLISNALESARIPLDNANQSRLIIKSISAKQRPRRPTK